MVLHPAAEQLDVLQYCQQWGLIVHLPGYGLDVFVSLPSCGCRQPSAT